MAYLYKKNLILMQIMIKSVK